MKHWGIWVKQTPTFEGGWLMDVNGMIFWTTSRAVAEAQFERHVKYNTCEIREFKTANNSTADMAKENPMTVNNA